MREYEQRRKQPEPYVKKHLKTDHPIVGSSVYLWKQDPSVQPIRVRKAFIHDVVEDGPKDKEIIIKDMPKKAMKDWNGNFFYDPLTEADLFDSTHTFCVVRQVVTMFERSIRRINFTFKKSKDITDKIELPKPWDKLWPWRWNHNIETLNEYIPLEVYPHAGTGANAYYDPSAGSLKFFYFRSQYSPAMIYTCRSFDIVAHETGHAILDSICPDYLLSREVQTGALHESFGDLTAILTMLSQMDVCETIIAESKTDLHNTHLFLPILAEEFGEALYGRSLGLRHADNDLKMSDVLTNEVHKLSNVFTGAVYDIIADMFEMKLSMDEFDPAETLFRAGRHMTTVLLLAFLDNTKPVTTFDDIAKSMLKVEYYEEVKDIMEKHFEKREINPDWNRDGGISYKNCCMSLQPLAEEAEGYNPTFLGSKEFPIPIKSIEGDSNPVPLKLHDTSGKKRYELKYTHFSIVMHKERKLPLLTACNINGAFLRGKDEGIESLSSWRFDHRIDSRYQCGNEIYVKNPLDRGHMVRRLDPVWCKDNAEDNYEIANQANSDTYYYTNAAPQQFSFNRGLWKELEDFVYNKAEEQDIKLSVFTGPIFKENDPEYDIPDTYETATKKVIQIPTDYWKLILLRNQNGAEDEEYKIAAYILHQEVDLMAMDSQEAELYQVSIDNLEKEIGINFDKQFKEYDTFEKEVMLGLVKNNKIGINQKNLKQIVGSLFDGGKQEKTKKESDKKKK